MAVVSHYLRRHNRQQCSTNHKTAGLIMKKCLVTVLVVMGMMVAGGAQAAGDVDAGQARAALCIACHGPGGNSLNPMWPKLAGQHPAYIVKQLQLFKGGVRKDPMMAPMAVALDEKAMADLAAYFSSQKRSAGVAAADKVELGGKIYRGGNKASGVAACMACHGPTGAGNPAANFPNLAGQQAIYVEKALKDFRSGARVTDPNMMMRGVAAKMTDAEITAVAQFVQGLK